MTRRSRGREVALQVLYQVEQNPSMSLAEVRLFIQRRLLGERKFCEFTEVLVAGVKEHLAKIDEAISAAADNWRVDRMAAIDRNILRLGVYEMIICREIPSKVAINEALELAKRYSTAQSSRFVNGILDRVLQSELQAQAQAIMSTHPARIEAARMAEQEAREAAAAAAAAGTDAVPSDDEAGQPGTRPDAPPTE